MVINYYVPIVDLAYMKKPSVIMVVAKYPATYGHTTVINNFCKYLNKIGYNTAIGAFSFDSDPPNNIQKIKLSKFKLLTKGIDYLNFDIIHTHQAYVNYYLLFKKSKKIIIQHYHAASNRSQEINLKIMMKFYKKRISEILCVSQKALNHFKEINGECNAKVVYNGVDTNFYNPKLTKKFQTGSPQLLFVSVLRHYKNTKLLVNAIPKLLKKYPKINLQIVGAGEDLKSLSGLVRKKKLEKYVELTGRIDDDELKLRYASCDIFISASKNEHCPVPPFEAMSCGKPLVLSDLESHNEILKASNAGLIFTDIDDLCNKIELVYENPQTYSENALKYAQKHDWANICEELIKIYDKYQKA
jgi:glycosyltransferase involved in cell wall biosynthesis